MDPVAIIALFCNVLDLGDRAIKTLRKAKEAHDSVTGLAKEHESLAGFTTELESICNDIQSSYGQLKGLQGTQMGAHVQSITVNCHELSVKVVSLLDRCRVKRQKSMKESIKATIRGLWTAGELEGLRNELEHSQTLLNTALAASTRSALDQVLSSLGRINGNNALIELQLQEVRSDLQSSKYLQSRLLQSLELSKLARKQQRLSMIYQGLGAKSSWRDVNPRYNDVHEAHIATFEWIFEESPGCCPKITELEPHLKTTFVDWLRRGEGIFHVAGKPGSGKSTLMKFIFKHKNTRSLLEEWSDGLSLILLPFFFWKADHSQSSLRALKRCLLWNAIRQVPDLAKILFPRVYNETPQRPAGGILDFSDTEVSYALEILFGDPRVLDTCRLFILIDGLDEFDEVQNAEDHSDLAQLVQAWISKSAGRAKACVSSRELPAFMDFPNDQRIRLQKLTESDIRSFVTDRLNSHPRMQKIDSRRITKVRQYKCAACGERCRYQLASSCLINFVIGQAEGVFLWVRLVLVDLRKCLSNGHTMAQLRARVDHTPRALEEFLVHMINAIEEPYHLATYLIIGLVSGYDRCKRKAGDHHKPVNWFVSAEGASLIYNEIESRGRGFRLDISDIHHFFNSSPEETVLAAEELSGRSNGLLDVEDRRSTYRTPISITHRSIFETLQRFIDSKLQDFEITNELLCQWACLLAAHDVSQTETVHLQSDKTSGLLAFVIEAGCTENRYLWGYLDAIDSGMMGQWKGPYIKRFVPRSGYLFVGPDGLFAQTSVLIEALYFGPFEYVAYRIETSDIVNKEDFASDALWISSGCFCKNGFNQHHH
ncbi:hypothetical protein HD806DRAFT_523297 [Xylariaceae sp. AK1471]|nr:hypothetical protein HD806DRAFT_523297 [Xylariaceae sp. AK1471]